MALLHTVMYHYVRDLPRTPYPRLKAMLTGDFRAQVSTLREQFEMATLESALAFLAGSYAPKRDLCLLTFDDGVAEHYDTVTPILAEAGIEGQFFLISSCVEEHKVAPVHMNHFLMAGMDFADYRREMLERLGATDEGVDEAVARNTYRWDTLEVARFKYLFNFVAAPEIRDGAVAGLFESRIGNEAEFARQLYVSWEQARAMQSAGMRMGGHTHWHRPLATLGAEDLEFDLGSCRRLLDANLAPQHLWPFSYPYGKLSSFSKETVRLLGELGFSCSFTTEVGPSGAGTDAFHIRRVDCKNALDAAAVSA
ncbi:MAG: polysaccharide deacetylase family protein [Bryobacteraceae bacterium]